MCLQISGCLSYSQITVAWFPKDKHGGQGVVGSLAIAVAPPPHKYTLHLGGMYFVGMPDKTICGGMNEDGSHISECLVPR